MGGAIPGKASRPTLRRLPVYLQYLHRLREEGVSHVSAPGIARALQWGEVQVRKDLAAVSSHEGKPKIGFSVGELIEDITRYLCYDNLDRAALCGAGKLGQALLSYRGFDRYGLDMVAAFDTSPEVIGRTIAGRPVYAMEELAAVCRQEHIFIGVLTVPAEAAQETCNRLVDSGILAIWNFAPIHLSVPPGILVQNENMAASLALLSQHLQQQVGSNRTEETA